MTDDLNSDDFVSDIIQELKKAKDDNLAIQEKQKIEPMDKEKLESFIMDNSGSLIKNGVDTVLQLQNRILTGNADEIVAYSEVMKSVVSCLETLNKIVTTDKNIKNKTEMKKLDIQTKLQTSGLIQEEKQNQRAIAMTPEQLYQFISKSKEKKTEQEITE